MTNSELFNNFIMIETTCDNVFDKYCKLKDLEEEYKTTLFYEKFSNYSIIDAYNLYVSDSTSIGTLLRDFKNVDLPNLLEIITEKLNIANSLENLDSETAELLKLMLK